MTPRAWWPALRWGKKGCVGYKLAEVEMGAIMSEWLTHLEVPPLGEGGAGVCRAGSKFEAQLANCFRHACCHLNSNFTNSRA